MYQERKKAQINYSVEYSNIELNWQHASWQHTMDSGNLISMIYFIVPVKKTSKNQKIKSICKIALNYLFYLIIIENK